MFCEETNIINILQTLKEEFAFDVQEVTSVGTVCVFQNGRRERGTFYFLGIHPSCSFLVFYFAPFLYILHLRPTALCLFTLASVFVAASFEQPLTLMFLLSSECVKLAQVSSLGAKKKGNRKMRPSLQV